MNYHSRMALGLARRTDRFNKVQKEWRENNLDHEFEKSRLIKFILNKCVFANGRRVSPSDIYREMEISRAAFSYKYGSERALEQYKKKSSS